MTGRERDEDRELPGSEERRGNEPADPARRGEGKWAAKNQGSVKPEDYEGASQSSGGAATPKK